MRVEPIGVLDPDVEPRRDVAGDVLEADRPLEGCRRRGVREYELPHVLQAVAKVVPGSPQRFVVFGVPVRHRLPRFAPAARPQLWKCGITVSPMSRSDFMIFSCGRLGPAWTRHIMWSSPTSR